MLKYQWIVCIHFKIFLLYSFFVYIHINIRMKLVVTGSVMLFKLYFWFIIHRLINQPTFILDVTHKRHNSIIDGRYCPHGLRWIFRWLTRTKFDMFPANGHALDMNILTNWVSSKEPGSQGHVNLAYHTRNIHWFLTLINFDDLIRLDVCRML